MLKVAFEELVYPGYFLRFLSGIRRVEFLSLQIVVSEEKRKLVLGHVILDVDNLVEVVIFDLICLLRLYLLPLTWILIH
jgi:hypothetical protein